VLFRSRADISLSALDVASAVKAISNKDLAGGKLNLNVDFNASGLSPADLVSSLSGRGDMRIGGLDVKQGGSGTALAGIIGLVSAVNQIGGLSAGGSRSGLADMGLSFDSKDGVATSNDFTLKSALGSGAGAGSVDLAAWGIDFSGNMTVEANLLTTLLSKGRVGRQEIPFTLKGALDKPGGNLGIKPASGQPRTNRWHAGTAAAPTRHTATEPAPTADTGTNDPAVDARDVAFSRGRVSCSTRTRGAPTTGWWCGRGRCLRSGG